MTTALTTIEDARKEGALVYVNEGHLKPSTPLYTTQETRITLDLANDVHNISGKLMPKREVVDRIGEAAGISFVSGNCRTWSETRDDIAGKRTVFISEQQGKVRLQDGSWRNSSVEAYEFDPNLRAMLDMNVDEWNEQTKQKRKIGDDGQSYGKTMAMLALEYSKHGRQRAETGARLRVIKALTGMPTAFNKAEAAKPMLFSRVMQNTDYILQTAEGRTLATAQALGMDLGALYGKRAIGPEPGGQEPEMRNVTGEEPGGGEPPAGNGGELAGEAGDDWEDMAAETKTEPPDEFQSLTVRLEEYLTAYKDALNVTMQGKTGLVNPWELGMKEFNNTAATPETRRFMINKIKKFLEGKGVAA
jgi:hypothetical protein